MFTTVKDLKSPKSHIHNTNSNNHPESFELNTYTGNFVCLLFAVLNISNLS